MSSEDRTSPYTGPLPGRPSRWAVVLLTASAAFTGLAILLLAASWWL